jgi:ferric-dicitrate binding protein FerR (iron transport regulator)
MHELIVKRLRGEATDIESRQLDRWRGQTSENEGEYRAFVELWNRAREVERPAVGPAPDVDAIVREGDARKARRHAAAGGWGRLRPSRVGYGLAAAAAVALLFLGNPWSAERNDSAPGLFPTQSFSSPRDVTTLSLSDGSVMRTMPDTRVDFPATADRREVVLDGRAFFAVTADATPFVVRTHFGNVTVRGTRFEVATGRDEVRVVVVEGTVRLAGESGVVEVGADQVAYLRPGSSPRVMDHGDVWTLLEWADGLLVYEATPLGMVAEELGRHFGRQVTIVDESLRRVRVTASFQDEPLEEVVSVVCLIAGTPCEVGGTEVIIGR